MRIVRRIMGGEGGSERPPALRYTGALIDSSPDPAQAKAQVDETGSPSPRRSAEALEAARVLIDTSAVAPWVIAGMLVQVEVALGIEADASLAELARGEQQAARGPRRRLRAKLGAQHRRLARAQRARWSPGEWRSRRLRLLLRGGLLVGGVLGFWLVVAQLRGRAELGWRATYYPRMGLSGASVVQHDREIAFRWKRAAPLPTFPKDGFSVRWESCLRLETPATIFFRLGSDDGSRLFVDGEAVIDRWREQGFHWAEGSRALEAGRHRVKVEYFEKGDRAGVSFEAHEKGLDGPRLGVQRFHLPDDAGGC